MNQITIGICDDQPEILQALQRLLCEICDEKKIRNEIRTFTDGNELLKQIDQINVVFLDIEMPQMDGIEVGKRIKECNVKCKVIMATSMVERFKEAFQIQALRFVTKPFIKAEIKEALEAAIEGIFFTKSIEVYAERNKYEVPEEEIILVKAYDGYVFLEIGERTYRKNCSLDELEDVLNPRLFVRISREVILNFRWVQYDGKGKIRVKSEVFLCSRRRKKEFEQKFIEFDLKYRKAFGG